MSRTNVNRQWAPPAKRTVHNYRVIRANGGGTITPLDTRSTSILTASALCSEVRSSGVTPGYVPLRKQGKLKPLDFAYEEVVWSPANGYLRTTTRNKFSNWDYDDVIEYLGCVNQNASASYVDALPSAFIISNLQSQCTQAALLKVKDQDVNLMEVWGERHETVKMIGDNANRIGKTYAALRHGDFRGAAAALGVRVRGKDPFSQVKNQSKAISNGWLELQYGWRPLIQDVYGGVEFLKKSFSSPHTSLMKSTASKKFSDERLLKSGDIVNGLIQTTNHYDLEVKTFLYYRRNDGPLATLSALGITNPAYLAWELTKYSFVVDWFVHIGDFISSLDATFGYSFYAGCVTTCYRAKSVKHWYQDGTVGATRTQRDTMETSEKFSCQRSALITWPLLSLPAFKDPRSVEHALNAIALLRQSRR